MTEAAQVALKIRPKSRATYPTKLIPLSYFIRLGPRIPKLPATRSR